MAHDRDEAAVNKAERPAATIPIRVDPDVHAELVRLQQEHRAAHGGTISYSEILRRRLLADRKPAQP